MSFPDLGKVPFDGSTPIILYVPDCGVPIPDQLEDGHARVGDAPRVEIALPGANFVPGAVAADPYLTDWIKTQPGPVKFTGTPCSFPGRVWKSKVGNYWNMLCALDGKSPWARFTSSDPSLMTWKLADKSFTQGKDTNGAAGINCHVVLPESFAATVWLRSIRIDIRTQERCFTRSLAPQQAAQLT